MIHRDIYTKDEYVKRCLCEWAAAAFAELVVKGIEFKKKYDTVVLIEGVI